MSENHPPNFEAKTWEPVFSKNRNFRENLRYVELRRLITSDSDDFGIFWKDTEDPAPLCTIEEVEEFCQDMRLDNLESVADTEGQPRRAWLDDRSFPRLTSSECVRKYDNPLTATQLYQLLKTPVWEGHLRERCNANHVCIRDMPTRINPMQTDALCKEKPILSSINNHD